MREARHTDAQAGGEGLGDVDRSRERRIEEESLRGTAHRGGSGAGGDRTAPEASVCTHVVKQDVASGGG